MAVAPPHHTGSPGSRRGLRRRLAAPGRWSRTSLAVLLVATMTFSISGAVRPTDAGVAPRCSYGDVLTRYRGQGDWYRSLLDTRYRLSSASAPTDLVAVSRSGAAGYGYVRRIALADLTAMYRAARSYGAPFAVQSAYRSHRTQVATFNSWVRKVGYARAQLASARPGHSEHQLGTALDLRTPGGPEPWYYGDWGTTKAGAWLARNSWRYGWVLSYPKAKSPGATCYKYEPWHFRYVGRTIAAKIRASSLAPREWLYLKGAATGWSGGPPYPTPAPEPTPSASPSPAPSASPGETPTVDPSGSPAATPSESPSTEPSASPAESPAGLPSEGPPEVPPASPSAPPAASPSEAPTPGLPVAVTP